MGSSLQEVFQGRGDKKGQGYWIKRSIPLLLLVLSWLGVLLEFPSMHPIPWFVLISLTTGVYSVLHFRTEKRREYAVEFLFSLSVMVAGVVVFSKLPWLRLIYFPFVIAMTRFYPRSTVVPVAVLMPFLLLRSFLSGEAIAYDTAFSAAIILTALLASSIVDRHDRRRKEAVSSLAELEDNARSIALEEGMESLSSEEILTHYFASFLKTDEEIGELLQTVRQAVFADSASLFVPQGNGYTLRCGTEEKGGIILADKGLIYDCVSARKMIWSGELAEKKIEPGYIKNGKITSIIAVPILEGSAGAGVLAVDSARFQAFSEMEKNTAKKFGEHIARVLERERVYMRIKRDTFGLKMLTEGSSSLVSSLNIDVIVKNLVGAAEKIAPCRVFFFLSEGDTFSFVEHGGTVAPEGTLFQFKGTVVDMAVENRQPMYLSDVSTYKIPVMPFKTENVRSVFTMPMFYEDRLLGLLAMLSGEKGFLDTFQIDMLKVISNQAATSIANATLHAEIEKMATTDGLTGLFNHRLFQDKLSEEFRRMNRFSDPVSLLLTDIDYFKKVNDTYGHPVGDVVLKDVSKTIRETIRNIDVAARYGGEEFAVILPGAGGEGAKIIAERLRKAVLAKTFYADGKSFAVTMSVGVATSPADAANKEELIEKADQALYHAKHNGRNRSVLWSGIR
jgi:diguanylate cyclase (GGDEF)-like protein